MKKREGFTLIELLAVIVILAVIALIATPIVLDVVDNAQKKADLGSANGLIDAGRLYYSESLLDETKKEKLENYENLWDQIVIQGEKPQNGFLYVNPSGKVALSVIYRHTCYQKRFETGLETLKESDCGLGFVGIDTKAPEVKIEVLGTPFNEFNWAKEDFYIQVEVIDQESGPSSYTWCSTTNSTCNPTDNSLINGSRGTVTMITESDQNRVCVIGRDQAGNESELICSELYKLDKTVPNFEGLSDVTINLKDVLDLETGIKPIDSLSGIDGTFEYNPKEVDRTKTGTTDITYTTKDKAGNIGTMIRKVKTVADAPSITYTTPSASFNRLGWEKNDFYVHVEASDYTGHGMKEIKWCSTTNTVCDPQNGGLINGSNEDINITTESDQNRVCVIGIDQDNTESEVICSNPYKLDKTPPSLNGVGDITIRKDQSVDLTSGVTWTDGLSGVNGTYTYNPMNVDTSKSGSNNITYKIVDNAGNEQIYIRKIIVEASAPTVTFTAEPGKINGNGWSNSDFLVTFTSNDQSGHGIKEFKWCSTTNSSCDPSGNAPQSGSVGASTINIESASNRICVIATDHTGASSTNICSDGYRLDKTVPVAGSFNVNGTVGSNGWYVSDVILSANNGTDSLSGHASTTISAASVTGNTSGTNVTITTSDLAGNMTTRIQMVKIDQSVPTISINPTSVTILEGTNYDLNTGVVITDLGDSGIVSKTIKNGANVITNTSSLKPGTYSITYTAIDGAGNTTSKTRNIVVNAKETLKAYILRTVPLVGTNVTGLHQTTDYFGNTTYIYQGKTSTETKNYIQIDGNIYQIISISNDGTFKIISPTIGKHIYDSAGARTLSINSYCYNLKVDADQYGCNPWSRVETGNQIFKIDWVSGNFSSGPGSYSGTVAMDSELKTYLNGTYWNSLSTTFRNRVLNKPWYFGAYDLYNAYEFSQIYRYSTSAKVGLINKHEEISAALPKDCTVSSSGYVRCDGGWLSEGTTWTISAFPDINMVRPINGTGGFALFAANSYDVRPVFNIIANTYVTGGTGTKSNPFIVL